MNRLLSIVLTGLICFSTSSSFALEPLRLNLGQFDCRATVYNVENKSAPALELSRRFTQQLLVEAGNVSGQFFLMHQPRHTDSKHLYFGHKDIDSDFTNTPFEFSVKQSESSTIRSAVNTGPCRVGLISNESGQASVQIENHEVHYTLVCRSVNRFSKNVSSRVEQVTCTPMNAKKLNMSKIVDTLSR